MAVMKPARVGDCCASAFTYTTYYDLVATVPLDSFTLLSSTLSFMILDFILYNFFRFVER